MKLLNSNVNDRYEAVKVCLDPSTTKRKQLFSGTGAARFIYNYMLNHLNEAYSKGIKMDLSKYGVRNEWNAIKNEVAPWHSQNSKEIGANACFNLATAYKNYFDSCKGKRRGEKVGKPKFKKKGVNESFTIGKGHFSVLDAHHIRIAKIGAIHCFENVNKRLRGREPKSITVSYDGVKWYASILVKADWKTYNKHKALAAGYDAGVKSLAIGSDGDIIENQKFLRKLEKKLAKAQHDLARKKGYRKGEKQSANYKKQKLKVNKIHKRILYARKDYIEKQTTEICKTYKIIGIENLKVKNMMSNHKLAKSVQDASMGMFLTTLCRKASKYNNIIFKVDTFYPSSKTCSACGQVKTKLDLDERVYKCEECDNIIDRDLNAAINLRTVAVSAAETLNACGESLKGGDVRLVSLSEISKLLPKNPCAGRKQVPTRDNSVSGSGAFIGNDKLMKRAS